MEEFKAKLLNGIQEVISMLMTTWMILYHNLEQILYLL